MQISQNFKEVGNLDEGELVIKLPGTNFKMPYQNGKCFLNEVGVGYVALAIRETYCEEDGEAEGMLGRFGRDLAELLNSTDVKKMCRELYSTGDHCLFYSQGIDGVEVLCIPGISGEFQIDDQNVSNMVVATYAQQGKIADVKEVYAYHMNAVGSRDLITDQDVIKKALFQLVDKSNEFYEKASEGMKQFYHQFDMQ